jgi:hypothetical protein
LQQQQRAAVARAQECWRRDAARSTAPRTALATGRHLYRGCQHTTVRLMAVRWKDHWIFRLLSQTSCSPWPENSARRAPRSTHAPLGRRLLPCPCAASTPTSGPSAAAISAASPSAASASMASPAAQAAAARASAAPAAVRSCCSSAHRSRSAASRHDVPAACGGENVTRHAALAGSARHSKARQACSAVVKHAPHLRRCQHRTVPTDGSARRTVVLHAPTAHHSIQQQPERRATAAAFTASLGLE